MPSTFSSNEVTVDVLIDGERIRVNREIIKKESKLFNRVLSVPHLAEKTISIPDTTVSVFETLMQICEGKKNYIKKEKYSQLNSLSAQIGCDLVERKLPAYLADYFARVFCPKFLVDNKKHIGTLSSEAKTLLLKVLIDDLSELSAEAVWSEKEEVKMKKLEKKCHVLETQLTRALNDVRIAKDQQKSGNEVQSELVKLKKKLAVSEKKIKIQQEELDKLGKKLDSEYKKNQQIQKKLEIIEKEKKVFDERLAHFKHSLDVEKETNSLEQERLQKETECLKETVALLQEENMIRVQDSKGNGQSIIDELDQEWRHSPPSVFTFLEESNLFAASVCEWRKKPDCVNTLFI